jgi:cytochrome c biogenesis protein CcmG/thiol:disulfide interchange protein DsbE
MFLLNRTTIIAAMLLALLCVSPASFGQKGAAGPADFSLRSIDGQTVTSQSLRGEVVVMAFGASWLPLSRTQLQGVKKLANQYSDRGVVVYWVSTEPDNNKAKNYASDEQLRAFSKKYGLDVTVLRDPDMVAAKKLGVNELPSVVILDKQGNVSGEVIKGLDPDGNLMGQLASQLDKIL